MLNNSETPWVRTVLGDIPATEMGVCYAHEHLHIGPAYVTRAYPEFLFYDQKLTLQELVILRAAGVSSAVDSMPADCGRDIVALVALSRASGLHIIAPTGLHLAKYYPEEHWSHAYAEEELARLFVADIMEGIDRRDYNGPLPVRDRAKAGVIKVAAPARWDERTLRIFGAAARAHLESGAPILTHTEAGELALEQAQFLLEHGVEPQHVVLSHLDRKPDLDYHRQVLRTGVNIEYDSHFRNRDQHPNPTLHLLRELLPEFPNQIVLGMDAARPRYWKSYGGQPGLAWLYQQFRPQLLQCGLSAENLDRVFIRNPQRAYSFREPVQ